MKLRASHIIVFLSIILFLSASSTYAFKASWDISVPADNYNYVTFVVEKDSYFIQMIVEVFDGGPVSAFILDEFAFEDLFTYGQPVVAYVGAENITLNNRRTLEGYLGPSRDNITGQYVDYYIVIDNREVFQYANVYVELVATIPASSALIALISLVPISLVVYKQKKKL